MTAQPVGRYRGSIWHKNKGQPQAGLIVHAATTRMYLGGTWSAALKRPRPAGRERRIKGGSAGLRSADFTRKVVAYPAAEASTVKIDVAGNNLPMALLLSFRRYLTVLLSPRRRRPGRGRRKDSIDSRRDGSGRRNNRLNNGRRSESELVALRCRR